MEAPKGGVQQMQRSLQRPWREPAAAEEVSKISINYSVTHQVGTSLSFEMKTKVAFQYKLSTWFPPPCTLGISLNPIQCTRHC